MSRSSRWVVFSTLILLFAQAQAAVWTVQENPKGTQGSVLIMQGTIVPGDSARLMRVIGEKKFGLGMRVHLDSPGGDVSESYAIGRVLRRQQSVVTHGVCASACVFSYLGGFRRITQESYAQNRAVTGLVIHQPEGTMRVLSTDTEWSAGQMRELRNYTVEMLRTPDFYAIMVNVPFNAPVLLKAQDALALNVATDLIR
jgi:hypothetical protein